MRNISHYNINFILSNSENYKKNQEAFFQLYFLTENTFYQFFAIFKCIILIFQTMILYETLYLAIYFSCLISQRMLKKISKCAAKYDTCGRCTKMLRINVRTIWHSNQRKVLINIETWVQKLYQYGSSMEVGRFSL